MAVHSCCKLIYPLVKVGLLTKAFSLSTFCVNWNLFNSPTPTLNMWTIFKRTHGFIVITLPLHRTGVRLGLCPVSPHSLEYKLISFSVDKRVVSWAFFSFLQSFALTMWAFCCGQSLLSYSFLEKVNKQNCFLNHPGPNPDAYVRCDVYKEKQINNSLDLSPLFILHVCSSFNIVGAFR